MAMCRLWHFCISSKEKKMEIDNSSIKFNIKWNASWSDESDKKLPMNKCQFKTYLFDVENLNMGNSNLQKHLNFYRKRNLLQLYLNHLTPDLWSGASSIAPITSNHQKTGVNGV